MDEEETSLGLLGHYTAAARAIIPGALLFATGEFVHIFFVDWFQVLAFFQVLDAIIFVLCHGC